VAGPCIPRILYSHHSIYTYPTNTDHPRLCSVPCLQLVLNCGAPSSQLLLLLSFLELHFCAQHAPAHRIPDRRYCCMYFQFNSSGLRLRLLFHLHFLSSAIVIPPSISSRRAKCGPYLSTTSDDVKPLPVPHAWPATGT